MTQALPVLLCLTLIAACCKKTNSPVFIQDGKYTGTFQRQTSTGGQVSNVTITFSHNNWTGQSEFQKYPALCHGTYKATDEGKITFENACPWTAEFDWTLILSYDYSIKIEGKYLEISRDYNGAYKDIYKLTKQL